VVATRGAYVGGITGALYAQGWLRITNFTLNGSITTTNSTGGILGASKNSTLEVQNVINN